MKYLIEPTNLKTSIQLHRKGLKYSIIVTRFKSDGGIDYKDYIEVFTRSRARSIIVDVIEENFYWGMKASEMEICNYTKVNLKISYIKVWNCWRG